MSATEQTGRRTKIVLADDHEPFRRAFKSLFRANEAEFFECKDGHEALLLYSQHRPDWVVLDFDMSPVDGLTATEQIRGQFPEARIILITLHSGEDIQTAVRKAGAVAYIKKENLLQARDLIRSTPT
jgi:two-component system response regulator DegU